METEPCVKTIDAAMNWFLDNHDGAVLCVADNGQEKHCNDFDEARTFFITNEATR
jgi:hypothetical protein